jgi:hypothetical protein
LCLYCCFICFLFLLVLLFTVHIECIRYTST